MQFPILIDWTSPFQGGIFFFLLKLVKKNTSTVSKPEWRTRSDAASDLVLHYLPMSNKKDAMNTYLSTNTCQKF